MSVLPRPKINPVFTDILPPSAIFVIPSKWDPANIKPPSRSILHSTFSDGAFPIFEMVAETPNPPERSPIVKINLKNICKFAIIYYDKKWNKEIFLWNRLPS